MIFSLVIFKDLKIIIYMKVFKLNSVFLNDFYLTFFLFDLLFGCVSILYFVILSFFYVVVEIYLYNIINLLILVIFNVFNLFFFQ